MTRNNTLGLALVVLALVLFTVPALFPVQAVLTHDTGAIAFGSEEELEENGVTIIAYENLSQRGQELYVRTLRNGGTSQVSPGNGAPEFPYLTDEERTEARRANPDQRRPGIVAIERPEDADLPPADEPAPRGEGDERDEHFQQVQRYDLMETSTGLPPLNSSTQLLRLAFGLLAVVAFCIGGYLVSLD